MKSNYFRVNILTISFVLLVSAISLSASRKSVVSWDEVIIQIPGLNEKNEVEIKSELLSNKGVQYISTCLKLKVINLRVDRDVQEDDLFLLNTFKVLQMPYHLKVGSIAQIHEACGLQANDSKQN